LIEEITKLRGKGLTFRKIAEELDTTIGKIQYQWRKYNSQKDKPEEENVQLSVNLQKPEMLTILQKANWSRKRLIPVSFLSKWFTGGEYLFPYWNLIDSRRESFYTTADLTQYPKAVRMFDVTSLPAANRSALHTGNRFGKREGSFSRKTISAQPFLYA